jgi:hypothetical protein
LILHRVASPSLLNHGRVGLDRVRGHARSPAKPRELGVHDGAELARCCMPEDPASPVQARGGGYVVACAAFYERGFGVAVHQFLHSLL